MRAGEGNGVDASRESGKGQTGGGAMQGASHHFAPADIMDSQKKTICRHRTVHRQRHIAVGRVGGKGEGGNCGLVGDGLSRLVVRSVGHAVANIEIYGVAPRCPHLCVVNRASVVALGTKAGLIVHLG